MPASVLSRAALLLSLCALVLLEQVYRNSSAATRRSLKYFAIGVGVLFAYDLFLGVPVIRAPKILEASGMTEDGYVPVKPKTLETRFPEVYAVGDCVSPRRMLEAIHEGYAVAAKI